MGKSTEINPLKRNISAEKQITDLDSRKSEILRKRREKQIELDVIDSDISPIEAQIANIMMCKRRKTSK